ncbi:MAG: PQQ-binding-like beta-propeller repeat protein [Planctomycetes bacterium]|nr:PQQ-binding-like beta-propeller repeat protein [Planctomycetota bacterium]
MRWLMVSLVLALLPPIALTQETVGWRGNWTGLWPDAKTPLHWHRIPRGVLADVRTQTDRPKPGDEKSAPALSMGLVPHWLVAGPFPVNDSIKEFDKPLIDEAGAAPTGNSNPPWLKLTAPFDDPNVFGTATLPFVDLAKAAGGFKINQYVYAHAYVYTPRAGTLRGVVEHTFGMKIWLNGQVVYRDPQRREVFSTYPNLSRLELAHSRTPSPRFDLKLKVGWNRLLVKVSTPNKPGFTQQHFCLRFMDLPNVKYDEKNIAWMTELPGRSSSTPILVGDRIFLAAEPDELLCIDSKTGKKRWSASVNLYEALSPKEKATLPTLAQAVDPLVLALRRETDFEKRFAWRQQIQLALRKIDAERFTPKLDGHYESHFAIVGYTVPTPVSDGKFVYVWNGIGVAACYDLDGKRQWITRVPGEPGYASSPALVDGKLIVFMNMLHGLDATTGQVVWKQKKIRHNVAAVVPARLAGTPVVVTQRGHIVRAKDGHILWLRGRDEGSGDTGWAPPVILGNTIYALKYGVTHLDKIDCSACQGDGWQPKVVGFNLPEKVSRKPNGGWIDRWTAGGPVIVNDTAYTIDIWRNAFALDLKTKKMHYQHNTALPGYFHYNAVSVAASPALLGEHVMVQGNQGTALFLKQGPNYEVVARNQIGTVLDRLWPTPGQEIIGYAPPITDGRRIFLRGERYLYCIGH